MPIRAAGRPLLALSLALAGGLAGCGGSGPSRWSTEEQLSPRVVEYGEPVPRGGGVAKLGKPYAIAGQTYVPRADPTYDRVGVASWYGDLFHGRRTANGEVYDMDALTAAHPTMPLPSLARVTNLSNGRSLLVRVNDRGPYRHDRLIDLSRRTATLLDFHRHGTARVRVEYVAPAPLDGDDSRERAVLAAAPWAGPRYAALPHDPRRDVTYALPAGAAPAAAPPARPVVAAPRPFIAAGMAPGAPQPGMAPAIAPAATPILSPAPQGAPRRAGKGDFGVPAQR